MFADSPVAHAAERWARAVAGVLESNEDPNTVAKWGTAIGVSEGALRAWCRSAGLSAKKSLDFARLLRVMILATTHRFAPEQMLDVIDRRTMCRLLLYGGFGGPRVTGTVEGFLQRQTFVTNEAALAAVRARMAA